MDERLELQIIRPFHCGLGLKLLPEIPLLFYTLSACLWVDLLPFRVSVLQISADGSVRSLSIRNTIVFPDFPKLTLHAGGLLFSRFLLLFEDWWSCILPRVRPFCPTVNYSFSSLLFAINPYIEFQLLLIFNSSLFFVVYGLSELLVCQAVFDIYSPAVITMASF